MSSDEEKIVTAYFISGSKKDSLPPGKLGLELGGDLSGPQ